MCNQTNIDKLKFYFDINQKCGYLIMKYKQRLLNQLNTHIENAEHIISIYRYNVFNTLLIAQSFKNVYNTLKTREKLSLYNILVDTTKSINYKLPNKICKRVENEISKNRFTKQ